MPIILPREKGSNALLETDYHIIIADNIGQLGYEVGEILKRNVDEHGYRIFTVTGGPVYDPEKEKWYQAITSHEWIISNHM